ncbi:MAG: Gfo/Idh/MocA family oxidoreductase [Rhizobiales bacterium]|nr:Gfo/Idh/MocA family oxidoreductase [Hyphomicrobiales bacterium]
MSKVRFAVIGAGWISQEAFLPAVSQTGNAEVTAIVSGDAGKAAKLAAFHGVPSVYDYSEFDVMAKSGAVDAVYIATPNSSHCEYAVRAARHGLHCLVEKPLATTAADSEAMVDAARKAGVYLVTAYRLHTDPATIKAIELVRHGAIGEVRHFSSVFSFQLAAGNHRLQSAHWGGPLQDLGVYCLNAARHVFGANPLRVSAMSSFGNGDPRFGDVEEGLTVALEFPGGRLAQFYVGFGTDAMDMYQILGTKGSITLWNGYRFEMARRLVVQRNDATETTNFEKTENFSGMIAYFADCIREKRQPRADGTEGLCDMQVMLAIEAAAKSGHREDVPPLPDFKSYDASMIRSFPPAVRKLLV